MDDGLTTTMAMMGYRVVDRIGSDRSSMDRWRCARRDARGICVRNICIYMSARIASRVSRVYARDAHPSTTTIDRGWLRHHHHHHSRARS